MKSGLLLFCQHAYPASLKGACGQNNLKTLRDFIQTGRQPKNLRQMLLSFPNAVKSLKRLSRQFGIKDIFDYRLVEAYWLGNSLLESFPKNKKPFHLASLLQNLKPALKKDLPCGVKLLENCRISYGQIVSIEKPISQKEKIGKAAIIEYNPLGSREKTVVFQKDKIKKVNFIDSRIKKDDCVSLHHNYICSILTEKQLIQLAGHTLLQLFF
ncbi:MAG: DUF6390 family protein [bacterium]|nr:DUF6390 family protein [bacterium]